jgi:hypothetical protein
VNRLGCKLAKYPEARNVTYFEGRGVAFHHYPSVPTHPASHGCVRLGRGGDATPSRLIYDNVIVKTTKVSVTGTWSRGTAKKCWDCRKKKKTKPKVKP